MLVFPGGVLSLLTLVLVDTSLAASDTNEVLSSKRLRALALCSPLCATVDTVCLAQLLAEPIPER